jgi:hypothetical protein
VSSQASDLRERKIGITPFDCPCDSGIYLPAAYLEEILTHGSALGGRGGQWLGYDTVDRYVTTRLFVALVREGWIGTRGVTTRAIEEIVEAAVGQGHSVTLAEEEGDQTGRERRGRGRPVPIVLQPRGRVDPA